MRAWRRGSRAKSPGPLRPPPPHCRDGRPRSRCKPTRSRLRGAPSRAASRSGSADKAACTMLESAEVGHTIAKAAYAREEPRLREALLNAQYDLSQPQKGPVLLIITGVEGGGRSET